MPNFFDDTQQESVNFFDDTQDAEYQPAEVGGFFASAKQAVGATIKGAGQLAGDLPGIDDDNALKRYGRSVIDANPTIVHGFGDMADNKLSTVTEATGNAAGSMGGMLGARALGMGITAAAPLTGPLAPATAMIGQAVAWLGPMAIAALPSYGGIREKQIINDPTNNEDWKSKAVAAMGAATVGAIETKFGPQNWALGAMTKEGRTALAKKFAQTTLAKGVGFGIVKGGAIEGAEELVQNPVEQVASYDDPTTAKSLEETAFGGAMGAIGGGVLGGGVGGVAYGMRTQAQPQADIDPIRGDIDDIANIQTVQDEIAGGTQDQQANPGPAVNPTAARWALNRSDDDLAGVASNPNAGAWFRQVASDELARRQSQQQSPQQRMDDAATAFGAVTPEQARMEAQALAQRRADTEAAFRTMPAPSVDDIGNAGTVDDAIAAAASVVNAPPAPAAPMESDSITDAPAVATQQNTMTPEEALQRASDTVASDAEITRNRSEQTRSARMAMLDAVLEDAGIVGIKSKLARFAGDLQRTYGGTVTNPTITEEEWTRARRHSNATIGLNELDNVQPEPMAPTLGTPNTMPADLVREKVAPVAQQTATANPLPEQYHELARASKTTEQFWKGLNALKVPLSGRGPLTAGYKAFRKAQPASEVAPTQATSTLINVPSTQNTAPANAAKEPWQMTRAEWDMEREAIRPNNAQSNFTKASGSQAVASAARLQTLLHGVSDAAGQRLQDAQAGKITLSQEEAEALLDRVNAPVTHQDVIDKAIAEGSPVPAEVRAEYATATNIKPPAPATKPKTRGGQPEANRLSSSEWANEGKSEAELRVEKMSGHAAELAVQLEEESSESDFDPNDAVAGMRQWAKEGGFNEVEYRAALIAAIEKRANFRRKAGALAALKSEAQNKQQNIPESIPEAAKPLYASRAVTNAADIIAWAMSQGFKTTLPADDMHVTVAYSKQPVDGAKAGHAGSSVNIDGDKRTVEPLGDGGAVVLKFASDELQARWKEYRDAGASWDYEGYTPHVTLTYDAAGVDLSKVIPYAGPIRLGAESQEALNEDKADEYTEESTATAAKAEPQDNAAQAESILDAANITGSERINALKDVKKGEITVDELARAHPARAINTDMANSDDVVGNQGGRSADDATPGATIDESTGLPLNADGTVTVFHHTSKSNADAIRKSGKLKADAEPDVYVTTHSETDTGYGDTAVAIHVQPDQLTLDDEFPSGRKDFRLNVGKPGGSIKVTFASKSTAPLSGAKEPEAREGKNGSIPIFSIADNALPESQWLSAGVLEDIVEKHMAQFATPIPVRIADRTADVVGDSVEVQGGVVAGGVTKGGVVHLIREGLPTSGEAVKTLFHELLHFGLRRFLSKDQYISTMRRLYLTDGWIRAETNRWVSGEEGRGLRVEGYALDYIQARGVDEALASLSETINTTETGYNNTSLKAKTIRTISRWLARLADTLGFTEAADRYRAVNNDEARALIKSIFSKLRDGTAPETTSTEWQHSDPAFSVTGNARPTLGDLNVDQQAAATNVLGTPKTLKDHALEFKQHWQKNLIQGVFDQFAPIKELSESAYIKTRMTRGGDSTLEALMMYGKVEVDSDGYYRSTYQKANGKEGFAQAMAKLKGEHDRFFLWVAAHRAGNLATVGLENLFSASDVTSLKTLNQGQMKDGTNRAPLYLQAMKDLNDFNDSVLKIAEDSGLIGPETRKLYKDMPYIPFYRLQEEGVVGFGMKAGMVNQTAWKKLKGGSHKLNEDLMANLLQNWSHLITASAKNRAAKATLDAAVQAGVAAQVPSGAPGKGTVSYREGAAEKTFLVSDPHLMDAIGALEYAGLGPWAKPLTTMKRMLTIGVTVNPTFKIRNLIRDTIHSVGVADVSYNPLSNIRNGWMATADDSETKAQMLASGGMIRFGSMMDGASSHRAKDLIHRGVDPSMVLDSDSKVKAFWRSKIQPAFDAYQELGDRGEQVNRAALYQRLIDKGMSHGEASFWARDLMDFSSSGKWQAVRFLTQTVPFLNARLQGLYKLGRAGKQDIRRFGYVAGAVSLASIALLAAYDDDDDWKKREDWDRHTYWFFKVGDTAFRIPKPFEIGSIGTIAEMGVEYFASDEMTGKRFIKNLGAIAGSQLAMNPIPQLVKPMLDVYANKDSFTKRPIESMAMQRLQPKDRYSERTSEVARFLGSLGLPDPAMLMMGHYEQLSPVKIDALTRGYFSWLGVMATTAIDYGIRPMLDRGERPAMKLRDAFLVGNFAESLPSNSSKYVSQMYDQAHLIEQAYASYREALKQGDTEKAAELMDENRDKITAYRRIEAIKRHQSKINAQIKRVMSSRTMGADEKRRMIDMLSARRDKLAQRVASN